MDGKITSIRQIVKFKEFIKKWKFVALGPKSCEAKPSKHGGMSSDEIKSTLSNSNVHCESDEESSQSQTLDDVPKGYLAVYVGAERDVRRFIIPTSYLTDPLFTMLLDKAEEEFGFDHNGGLMIPCHIETFKYLLQCIKNHTDQPHHTNTAMMVAGTTASD